MWALILFIIGVKVRGEVDTEVNKVMEGGLLRLNAGAEELKGNIQILWTFEDGKQSSRLAQYRGNIYTDYDDRFTGRVQLDQQTGTLTISNIRTNDSGLYKALTVINKHILTRKYRVDVYAPVSVPAIRSSSLLSVTQTPGGEMLNQTNNPDLSINLSLPLKLRYNDTETYSCTAANPVSNKSIRPHMKELCPHNEGCLQHCGDVEVLIRLVLSGLVGIATVAFLVEHMRSCRAQGRTLSSTDKICRRPHKV